VTESERPALNVGAGPLSIEELLLLARGQRRARLGRNPELRARIESGRALLQRAVTRDEAIYGVTTGVGDSVEVRVSPDLVEQLPHNLMRFHGVGTGALLTDEQSLATVAARLLSLGRGYSAVRPEVLEALCDLLVHDIAPCIPAEGSVGASGDLTPLSYVAACIAGERKARVGGRTMDAGQALSQAGLRPLSLLPKESLALMNGTSVMGGLSCLAFESSRRLARLSSSLTAMASEVLRGQPGHFDDRIFELKPHPGQRACARWIREDLEYEGGGAPEPGRLQDRYSIRCAPHVIGVLMDFLPLCRQFIEAEINGVNDNPIVDPERGAIYNGGNFYGGHLCFAMDGLKNTVANLADLIDRQLALLCNPATNGGLPANLCGARGAEARVNFGFKAAQITTSALAAEALKLTMPASVFSRSTENHNQDKVSMGTIAARDCLRIIELTETAAAIHLLALCQAAELRQLEVCHGRSRALHAAVRARVPFVERDRAMDVDIAAVLELYRRDALPIGEVDWA